MNARQRRKQQRWLDRFIANAREVDGLWKRKDQAEQRLYSAFNAMRQGRK